MLHAQFRSPARYQVTQDALNDFYDLVAKLILVYKVGPEHIYNLDETGTEKLGHRAKVIVPKEATEAIVCGASLDEHMSWLGTDQGRRHGAATADHFQGVVEDHSTCLSTARCSEGTRVCYTREPRTTSTCNFLLVAAKAFITSASFRAWMRLLVAASGCTRERPVLVLVDNHSSRFDAAMREEAAEAGIILLALPANSTHITQPLDAIPFGVFKSGSHKAVDQAQLHGVIVNNLNRIELLAPAWRDAMSPKTISAAFAKTGIYPPRGTEGHQEPEPRPLPGPAATPAQAVLQLPDPAAVYTREGWLILRNMLKIPEGHDHMWVFPRASSEARDQRRIIAAVGGDASGAGRRGRSRTSGPDVLCLCSVP